MLFRSRAPRPELQPFIESLTLVVDEHYPYSREELFPDGAVDLLVNLGPHTHEAVLPGETTPRQYRRAWISGIRSRSILIGRAAHGYNLIGARFRPGGAAAFFGLPMCELTDQVVELEDIWGPAVVNDVAERIATRRTPDAMLEQFDTLLTARLLGRRTPGTVLGALTLLTRSALTIGIHEVAATLGASHGRLIRDFQWHVGLKPKLLQRVLRFQQAIALEALDTTMSWAAIAYRCGYHDQAHLSREFRLFTRQTPASYRKNRTEYPNYVAVP